MILWSSLLYEVYSTQSKYEWYAFVEYRGADKVFMVSTALFWTTSLLFLVRKLRKSWLLSLLVLIFSNAGYVFSLMLELPADNLSSEEDSWGIKVIQFFAFTVFIFLFYFILSRRKKLPYPSSWLR